MDVHFVSFVEIKGNEKLKSLLFKGCMLDFFMKAQAVLVTSRFCNLGVDEDLNRVITLSSYFVLTSPRSSCTISTSINVSRGSSR